MERATFYTTLIAQLSRRATRAVLGLCGFRNDALREYLRALFDREAGTLGAFIADPVFEAGFGWQPAEPASTGFGANFRRSGCMIPSEIPAARSTRKA